MTSIAFVTPTCSADGYGYTGEMLALSAVRDHAADLVVVGYDWSDERYSSPDFLALKVSEAEVAKRDVACVFFLPYALARFRARATLCMTMFETDRLPDRWAALINDPHIGADGVIVPSEFCARVFAERLDVPVRAVPFGTDGDLYAYRERRTDGECVFLMAGLLHYRKGVEFALRAFREEFGAQESARLVLKTRRGFLDAGDEWRMLNDDRVMLIDEDYTRKEMAALYYSATAFLAPSRGEGSGLTPRDAMATGLPVAMTAWSGLEEIADERYGYPIPIESLEAAPMENSSYGPGVTGGGPLGNFARPSIARLRAAMRAIFEDRDEATRRGKEAAAWMRRDFSWETCAGRWLDVIDEMAPAPTLAEAS